MAPIFLPTVNPYRVNLYRMSQSLDKFFMQSRINELPAVYVTPGCKCESCSLERERPWDGRPMHFRNGDWLERCSEGRTT